MKTAAGISDNSNRSESGSSQSNKKIQDDINNSITKMGNRNVAINNSNTDSNNPKTPLLKKGLSFLDDMIDNEEDFEAPCFCAQQLLGALFGCIFGYMAFLIAHTELVVAVSLSTGITFGLLASETANPCEIDAHEFWLMNLLLICQSFSLLLAFGVEDIFIVFMLIVMLSAVAAPIRSLMRYRSTMMTTQHSKVRGSTTADGYTTREDVLTAHAV